VTIKTVRRIDHFHRDLNHIMQYHYFPFNRGEFWLTLNTSVDQKKIRAGLHILRYIK